MDPVSGSTAGKIFKDRLEEFQLNHRNLELELRIKEASGAGGLLDSLSVTSAAAPLALPDLIALPNSDLETAALKGLLHPIDELDEEALEADWYEYAQMLATIQARTYGLPFAGESYALVYNSEEIPSPPGDWSATLNTSVPLAFPAADPQAIFTLSQYLAKGGVIRDDEGRPYLDTEIFTDVLIYFQEAELTGVMPSWLTQYESDQQIWEAHQNNQANMVVTSTSNYLDDIPETSSISVMPTPDGSPFALATGWIWAIPTHQPEHQEISLELAKFLTESEYLADWSEAAGYLPTRPSALERWSQANLRSVLNTISLSAQIMPSFDVLTSVGPVMKEATEQVLNRQFDPDFAAQAAFEALTGP
jgi:ABC-type glycerol-3-phosphate transport system substrate-binding protein